MVKLWLLGMARIATVSSGMNESTIAICIAAILISACILMLPYTISAYIIMGFNDFRSWCGF